MNNYTDYIIEETKKLLAIDSPTGYTREAAEYVRKELEAMGYQPEMTTKGGVVVALGGADRENAVLLSAHLDTLGAMVAEVKANGRLRLTPVGGLNANNVEGENCQVITRFNGSYEGTFQLADPSIHVNRKYNDTKRDYENMEVVLDEKAASKKEVQNLGIMPGDYVCFDPRTTVTSKGYMKSRFLDDKLSVGILLGYARYLKEEAVEPERCVYLHITVYEEVGHGACGSVPEGVMEMISVDMGCVGEGLECDECRVSICAKDSVGPYNYEVTTALVKAAKEHNIAYAVDIYPSYGSDVDAALSSGHDLKHGLIGPGVYASHGYERSHREGVENTFQLLKAYLG